MMDEISYPLHKMTRAAIEARPGGLGLAIEAAGGIMRLAYALGISEAAVSQWEKIPPDRVIPIEKLTGVKRELLRPDLYPERPAPPEENGAAA